MRAVYQATVADVHGAYVILFLLRCFPQFRELESDLESAVLKASAMEARAIEAESNAANDRLEAKGLREELRDRTQDLSNLQEAYDALTTDKTVLQDRLESAIADKEQLWATMQNALAGERYALQTMANHGVQKSGGGIPFPDAHSLPPNAVPKPQESGPIGRSARMLPSEIQARNTEAFLRDYVGEMKPKNGVVEVAS